MKLIINFSTILFLFFIVTSCHDDQGNYNYEELDDITIKFDKGYSALTFVDTLSIKPTITSNKLNTNLSYTWSICKTYSSTSSTRGEIIIDTISYDRNLKYYVNLDPGQYNLFFTLINNDNGLSYYHETLLTVGTKFTTGHYVLKKNKGYSDLDFFPFSAEDANENSAINSIHNLIKNKYYKPIPDLPTSFGIIYVYSYLNSDGNYELTKALGVGTANDMRIYDTKDLSLIYAHSEKTMFWGDTPVETPLYLRGHAHGVSYISNIGAYFSYQAPAWNLLGSGKFGYPENIEGGCSPDKNIVFQGTANALNFFDNKNRRFLSVDYNGVIHTYSNSIAGGAIGSDSPNNIPHNLLFYGGNTTAGRNTQFAIFEDHNDPSQRYLYHMVLDEYNNPIKKVTSLNKSSKFNQATMYATNETTALVIYFVYNNKLYLYDTSTDEETEVVLPSVGKDEVITYVSHRWYNDKEKEGFSYLALGTTKNGKYKVYLYSFLGYLPTESGLHILEGDGEVFGLHFVSAKMNENTYKNYSFGL